MLPGELPVSPFFATPLNVTDHNSDWFAVAYNNVYSKAHGMVSPPRIIIAWHSASSGGTGELVQLITNGTSTATKGATGADATNIYVACANDSSYGVISSQRRNSGGGYVRILAWA